MTHFSANLKSTRLKLGLSMQALSDMAKVSKSMISKIERSEVQPTLDIALRLSGALGKTLGEMLEQNKVALAILQTKDKQLSVVDEVGKTRTIFVAPPEKSADIDIRRINISPEKFFVAPPSVIARGEKYVYVLDGDVSLDIESQEYDLVSGDCIYLSPNHPYQVNNKSSSSSADILVVVHRDSKL